MSRRTSDARCIRQSIASFYCAGAALIELWRRVVDDKDAEHIEQYTCICSLTWFVFARDRIYRLLGRQWIIFAAGLSCVGQLHGNHISGEQ
jgi:hypothetical protein